MFGFASSVYTQSILKGCSENRTEKGYQGQSRYLQGVRLDDLLHETRVNIEPSTKHGGTTSLKHPLDHIHPKCSVWQAESGTNFSNQHNVAHRAMKGGKTREVIMLREEILILQQLLQKEL